MCVGALGRSGAVHVYPLPTLAWKWRRDKRGVIAAFTNSAETPSVEAWNSAMATVGLEPGGDSLDRLPTPSVVEPEYRPQGMGCRNWKATLLVSETSRCHVVLFLFVLREKEAVNSDSIGARLPFSYQLFQPLYSKGSFGVPGILSGCYRALILRLSHDHIIAQYYSVSLEVIYCLVASWTLPTALTLAHIQTFGKWSTPC